MNHQPVFTKARPVGEAFPENDVEEPAGKRLKLEIVDDDDYSNVEADEGKLSPRKARKPAHPVHIAHQTEFLPPPQSRVFTMDKEVDDKPSLIQQLVKHAALYQPVLHSLRSAEEGDDKEEFLPKAEEMEEDQMPHLASSNLQALCPSHAKQEDSGHDEFAALHNVADAAVALLGEENGTSDLHNVLESLQSGEHNLAALIAASEGLLSMKAMSDIAAAGQEDGDRFDDDVEAYPVPRPPRQARQAWNWTYVEQSEETEYIPSWSCRRNRSTDARVDFLLKHGPEDFYKEKDAKIRRQENSLKDRDRQIAKLQLQLKSERKQREKRVAELELDVKKQQLLEKQQEEDLAKAKAELLTRKDEARQQQAQIKLLKQELTQVHRRESDAAAAASDVQEELHKLQHEAVAANSFKQELVKYQAETAKHQREADRHATEVRTLQRSVKAHTKERDGLLVKLTEMAEQVRLFASLKERTCKMERVLTEITRRSDELRTSSKEADLEAFHTLKEIVAESVKLGVNNAEAAGGTSSSIMELLAGDGDKGRGPKEVPITELIAKEEEVRELKSKCRSYVDAVSTLEQRIEELGKSSGPVVKPGVWKARVPGGQTGEYHTYRMRSNAQVELPEGTLLSVPRSANMQSSSNSLLTKVHEGDLLNFMEVDMSSLSAAELGVATRQLLAMDMGALQPLDLSALLKKLGQVDISGVNREDVCSLAGGLIKVLGIEEILPLLEMFVQSPSNPHANTNTKSRIPMKPDMDRTATDASPKLYTNQISNRRSMSMASNNAPSRRDLSGASIPTGSRSMPSHQFSHHASMGSGNPSDARVRELEAMNQRGMMSRQGNVRTSGASDIPAQLVAQAMMNAPLTFSSAMLAASSQPMPSGNGPKNVMRRTPPNGVAIAANPGSLTHAQLASLVAGGGSPNVLSIPINQLNQLTQLGGMPVIVPGLTPLVHMPPNGVVQKPS